MWQVIDTGVNSADENMRLDACFLENIQVDDAPILHLYSWKNPSATFGHFIKIDQFIDLAKAKDASLDLGKRPTGGGIVFHLYDLAFSVLVPAGSPSFSMNTLENYAFVNNRVLEAIKNLLKEHSLELLAKEPIDYKPSCFNFCMAKPTIYDVMLNGQKVAGAAQRKTKQGFLHQGSISIALPDFQFLENVLKPDGDVLNAMKSMTWTILPEGWTDNQLQEMRNSLKEHLKQVFLGS